MKPPKSIVRISDLETRWSLSCSKIIDSLITDQIDIFAEAYDAIIERQVFHHGKWIKEKTIKETTFRLSVPKEHLRQIAGKGSTVVLFIPIENKEGKRWFFKHTSSRQAQLGAGVFLTTRDLHITSTTAREFEDKYNILETNVPKTQQIGPQTPQTTKRENTLLRFIGGLLVIHYNTPRYKNSNGKANASQIAKDFSNKLSSARYTDRGMADRTLREIIPEAMEEILQNKE